MARGREAGGRGMSDYDDHGDHDCQIEVESAMESYADHLRYGRPPAPPLSPEERQVVDRFEAAPSPWECINLDGCCGEHSRCFDTLGMVLEGVVTPGYARTLCTGWPCPVGGA